VKNTLEILLGGLAEGGIECLLVGGFALPVFGVVRQTVDVDCLIAEGALSRFSDVLTREGYAEIERTPNFVRYRHGSGHLMDVDALLVDLDTFDGMRKESVSGQVGPLSARVPSLRHLIALKLHAIKNNPKREPRDVSDIVDLLRANPDTIATSELRELCEKYGPDGIRQKLEGYL
jgi:predicted nucleotidyltransferase